MKATGINHVAISAQNLEESARFYEELLGLQRIPTYNFGFPTQYFRCGDLQIHVFRLNESVPHRQHLAIDVDDFHAVYEKAKELGALDSKTFSRSVTELPDGSVQMYIRDPSGNLIEVNWPDVGTLDRARIPEMVALADLFDQRGEPSEASLYLDRPHIRSNPG